MASPALPAPSNSTANPHANSAAPRLGGPPQTAAQAAAPLGNPRAEQHGEEPDRPPLHRARR
eukprot:11206516-Lingulodinium_polyedra.AAC.1